MKHETQPTDYMSRVSWVRVMSRAKVKFRVVLVVYIHACIHT